MSALIETWAVSTVYVVTEAITTSTNPAVDTQFQNKTYRCSVGHTSTSFTTDFGNGFWEEILAQGIEGPTGPKGAKGDTGATGATGAAGSNGSTGANGIFSAIASQAEAEAGTENTKGMTSLRTSQAIVVQVPNLTVITDIQAVDAAQALVLSDHETRINILEGTTSLVRARGEQRCNNNVAVAVDLEGDLVPGDGGKGNIFSLDADGADSARIEVEVFRSDDAEDRFVSIIFRMQFVNSTWFIARENTTDIPGNNPSGVVFDVTTLGNTGQVSYTSSNMAGGNYKNISYIRWFIEEISNNF